MSKITYGRGKQTTYRADRPITNEEIITVAPSILATSPHDSRGKGYSFIPTIDVLTQLRKEGFQPYEVRQTKCRDESKQDYTKHLLRLRHPDASVMRLDAEVPEIILINSHDGSSAFHIMSGIFRLICSNGLIAGDIQHSIRVRHSGRIADDVIEGSFRVVEELGMVRDRIQTYKSITLARPEQAALAQAAHKIRWPESSPVEPEQLLQVRRSEDGVRDLWTTFNLIQENIMHGGLQGKSATNRTIRTRAVQGVNENVRLNRALWNLTDRIATAKAESTTVDVRELALA